jgi:HTH-type transcriptional regulator/antitoxin HigA
MGSQNRNEYQPDTVTPPGFYIQEKLEELGMTQTDLAGRTGRTKKTVNEIVTGKAPIEPETALQLERVLGIPARFWNNAERHYRDYIVRQAERERLERQVQRLNSFPVKAMCNLGWLPKRTDQLEALSDVLNFFGAATFEALDQIDQQTCAAFRQSAVHRVDSCAVLAWLRKGELDARAIACQAFDKDQFRSGLSQIRSLTLHPIAEAVPETVRLCAASGVAVVFVPELPGTRTWGATRWLTPDKALIQLSARGKTDDQLWFTFFHEAGHILLHPKKDIFIELDDTVDSREDEADRFAADWLIPPNTWQLARRLRLKSAFEIQSFAKQYQVAPGILVGRMQREKLIPWKNLNGLKTRLTFKAPQSTGGR